MEPETQRLVQVLRTASKAQGISLREVERRLGYSSGYLSRLLAGKVEVRLDHVCAIARAIGLEPAEVFQIAFPRTANPPSEAATKLRAALHRLTPTAPPKDDPKPDEVEQVLERTLRRLFSELGRDPAS